ncbi:hypothetical protein Poli38472_000002 [Pythium oligandrum]|uniref:UBX domain-containing protein n=1 Tax=Pythium oligandrum TaxID=41045 RepID=A0A8K1CBV9_PYTOL|nr:hypothetical protein Poli38472_000002 [Pythium oligandrum]|eukprot:TMW59960.1 hypothetical protein Poli38472_000002 [Pythium oligandrum]
MEMDLNSRSAKWKREQDKQKERARRQQQTEALKRAAAEKARRELEAIQTQKRIERIQELERLEQQALEEQRVTGGIKYLHQLRPVQTSTDGDKITLPVSALEELNPQNAFDLGVFTFELTFRDASSNSTRKTHAGVLEFVAAEETVGIPPKVAASLFLPGQVIPETIQVRFVRLEKGRFASLQPKGDGFGEREIDFKKILERSLKAHTTLTVGDTVFVRHGRQTFEVAVIELQPESAVNILNTDLEVALLPSESVTKVMEAEKLREQEEAEAARLAQEKERLKEEKLQNLTPEPPVDERRQAKVVLRLPDGTQAVRRVAHSSQLGVVFELVEAMAGEDRWHYQLVATYPRRIFGIDSSERSLSDLGLNGRQESLFVERVVAAEPSTEKGNAAIGDTVMTEETKLPTEWINALVLLEQTLDEALSTSNATPIHALEPIIPVNSQSGDQQAKWSAQLSELETMGFTDRDLNIQVLERYQGRLLRVVNYLSELPVVAESIPATDSME